VTITAVGAATGLLAAHLLGPQGEGELAAIQTWPLLLASIAMLGLPEALTYFVARDRDHAKQFVGTGVLVALLSFLVIGSAAWLALPILLASQPADVVSAARVFVAVGVIYAVTGLPHGSLRGADRFVSWNLYRVAPGLAWLGILVGSAAAGHSNAIILSRWFLVGTAAAGIPFLFVVNRSLLGRWRPQKRLARRLLGFGVPSVVTTIPQTLNLRLDQLLIIAFLPSRSLGLYVVAVAWSGVISPLLAAVGSVLFPTVAAQADGARQAQMLRTTLQGAVLVAAVTTAALVALTPLVLPLLYGARFSPSVPAALFLAPAGAVLAWAGIAEEGLRGLGRPSAVLLAEGVGAAVTLGALPVALAADGITGAAVASLVGYSAVALTAAVIISHATDQTVRSLVVPTVGETKELALRTLRLLAVGRSGRHI
jgi:O-antigen/teichoic acid export membrane protein